MQHKIHEPIRVAVIFAPNGKIQPVWFEWQRRKHTVLDITYRYGGRCGEKKLLHFAVRDEGGLYELTYDTGAQTWTLQGIEVD